MSHAAEQTHDNTANANGVGSGGLVRRGWRSFVCDECGHKWEWPSRDRHSPSGENCPKCDAWIFPHASRPDASLPCDSMGNLLVPWNASPNTKMCRRHAGRAGITLVLCIAWFTARRIAS